jgi:hypothetical protein
MTYKKVEKKIISWQPSLSHKLGPHNCWEAQDWIGYTFPGLVRSDDFTLDILEFCWHLGDERAKPCWFLYQACVDAINPSVQGLQHPSIDIQPETLDSILQPRFRTKNMRAFLEALVKKRKTQLQEEEHESKQLAEAKKVTKAATAAKKSKKKAAADSDDEFDDL